MKFTLDVEMDNAAFADDPDSELARILHGVARVAQCRATFDREGSARDVNGNTVGHWRIADS